MIKTKEDLHRYLECDKKALGIDRKRPKFIGDRIWKYQRLYRYTEYLCNNAQRSPVNQLISVISNYWWKYKSLKWGNEIPINCIGEGLCIWHGQNIIINPNATIGRNFSISRGCVVGQAHNKFPVIGDNVTMTIDSKVLGGISICNNVVIGAGAVVVKSIDIPFSTWGGIPAHLLNRKQLNE